MYYSKLTTVRLAVISLNDGNMALSVDRLVTQTDIYKCIWSGTSVTCKLYCTRVCMLSLSYLSLCFIFSSSFSFHCMFCAVKTKNSQIYIVLLYY
jgi:hypothetical protein